MILFIRLVYNRIIRSAFPIVKKISVIIGQWDMLIEKV